MNGQDQTGAVIVAFHPEQQQLTALIDALRSQVDRILIVNNGPADSLRVKPDDMLSIETLAQNVGVGAAINRGVEQLIEQGFNNALLLDQDSQIESGLVNTLLRHLDQRTASGESVAAIGPRIRDHDDQRAAPFMRFRLPFNQRLSGDQGSVSCDFLITSGCLINLSSWVDIGPMREDWFIDNIDLEWCFRARRRGFSIIGCFDATLDHRIGERRRLLGIVPYRRHAPERLYTMMRNRIFLYRLDAPRAWIIQDALRAVGKLGLFSLVPPRWKNLKAMLSGLRDGWRTDSP